MAIHPRNPCWKWLLPPLRRNNYRMRRCKCSDRIIFGRSTWIQMVNVIGRLICRTMCRKITQFKMSHYLQKGILRITRFLFGTPMMGCWCWAIPQTATQNSPAITIPLQHFNDSPSLYWGCLAWMCCASFQPITFPNAESFTIPNRLCPLWKLWQTESQFHFISAENYRKLQAV